MLTTINKISCNLKDEMKKKNDLISIALVIVLIACSPTIEDSAEASLSNEETEEVLSQPEAKVGGTLVIYSGRKESLVADIISDFEATSGVEVEVRYAKSAELAGTIVLEGAISPADIFFSQDPISLGVVAKEGLFETLPNDILLVYLHGPLIRKVIGLVHLEDPDHLLLIQGMLHLKNCQMTFMDLLMKNSERDLDLLLPTHLSSLWSLV